MKPGPALLLTICVGWPSIAAANSTTRGEIYLPKRQKPSFFYEATREQNGNMTKSVTRYRDEAGKLLVEESSTVVDGKLSEYDYRQLQVDESGRIEVKGEKVSYTFTRGEKRNEDSSARAPDMLVPDMIPAFLQDHWLALSTGETVGFRLLLVEKQDDFGFKIFKQGERIIDGVPAVDFVMKPSSIFIAAVAPSVHLTVEKGGAHRVMEINGRLPVRVAVKEPPLSRRDFKAIDARLKFLWPTP